MVQIIFSGHLGSLGSVLKIEIRFQPVLRGVVGVAHFITGHEQTQ